MFDTATDGIRKCIVGLFVAAIKGMSRPEDRHAVIEWLLKSRKILASDLPMAEKLNALNRLLNARSTARSMAASIAEAVKGYKSAKIPLAMKVAMPATVLAMPLVGLHGAGLAAFGGAIGLPVLLLVFLGTAGITSIIETVAMHPNSRTGIALVVAQILQAEAARRAKSEVRRRMADEPAAPQAAPMPEDEGAQRAALLAMDPFAFEAHILAFFEKAGLRAVVTPRSKDYGMDGYAEHPDGFIVVQCKRYVPPHKVGFEPIQRFKTVMADAAAVRGYVATTSTFTAGAIEYAASVPGMVLVDMDALIRWHREGWAF